MGSVDSLRLDETLGAPERRERKKHLAKPSIRYELIVVLVATAVFFGCLFQPPSLMDDVDAVQAQIARNMLDSGDWVTARLDGVAYLEKSPAQILDDCRLLQDFRRARLGGAHSRGAVRSAAVLADRADRDRGRFRHAAGLYAGLALATCVGLFLFTRILIPDVGPHPDHHAGHVVVPARARAGRTAPAPLGRGSWPPASALGLLLKGLIAAVFPIGGGSALPAAIQAAVPAADVAAAAAVLRER